jgi:hypothetical protein
VSASKVFMDQAEALGLKPVLEVIAAHYAQGYKGASSKKNQCTCVVSPFFAQMEQRHILLNATHDLACPVHRFIVICGSREDKQALVDKSELFALELVRVVRDPAKETVEDFEYARSITGDKL